MDERKEEKKFKVVPAVEVQVSKGIPLIVSSRWRDTKTVFKCTQCGAFRDDRDAMIEHILLHYPSSEQEKILDQLTKEI